MPQEEQVSVDGGQVDTAAATTETSTVETPTTATEDATNGQATTAADADVFDPATYASKKGWKLDDPNSSSEIIKSYYNLEKKLGNWSEVEQLANEYRELSPQLTDWQQKAKQWDDAQAYLEKLDQQQQLQTADLMKVPAKTLADAWRSGQLSLAEMPKERQYEIQKFVTAEDAANEAQIQSQANDLATKFPIIKTNPDVADLIATKIEQGMIDSKTGKEMSPEQIAERVVSILRQSEKQGEERLKKDQEMIIEGNLERTGSVARTVPTTKVKSVREAFKFAQQQAEQQ